MLEKDLMHLISSLTIGCRKQSRAHRSLMMKEKRQRSPLLHSAEVTIQALPS